MGFTETEARGAAARFSDVVLWRSLVSHADIVQTQSAWLDLLVAKLDLVLEPLAGRRNVVTSAALVLGAPEKENYSTVARYGLTEDANIVLAKAAQHTLATRLSVVQVGNDRNSLCHITQPLVFGERLYGCVAIELAGEAKPFLEIAVRVVQWSVAWFGWRFRPADPVAIDAQDADLFLAIVSMAASGQSAAGGAEAVANLITERTGADRVVVGQKRGRRAVRVLAGSHGGLASVMSDFLRAILNSMDEAADNGSTIMLPENSSGVSRPIPAHHNLLREHDADWVVSIPCQTQGKAANQNNLVWLVVGRGALPANANSLTRAADLASRVLSARIEASRSPLLRSLTLILTRSVLAVFAISAIVGILAAGMLVRIPYMVTADATLEGSLRRAVIAPFDGYIMTANARPGDRVAEGAILAALDDKSVRFQKFELEARVAESGKQIDDALSSGDISKVSILNARRDQAKAQLLEVNDNLTRATLKAPFAGYIISGDKSQSIGAPVHRGDILYEISPLEGFRVAISVPQAEFSRIQIGETGQLVLSSLPFDSYPFKIERLAAQATSAEGKSTFRIEARLDHGGDFLRPGMQGIAHIDTGRETIFLTYLAQPVGWLRLKIWEYLP